MSGVHRYPTRNFRPNLEDEFDPAKTAIEAAGTNVNRVLRAVMRWIASDPVGALRLLAPYLAEVDKDTDPNDVGKRGGRPSKRHDGESPS